MVIHHKLGDIELDDGDAGILDAWKFLTVQNQGQWQYAILYGDKLNGVRKSKYLARAVLGLTDPNVEVRYRDGSGLNCHRSNLVTEKRSWKTRKKAKHAISSMV